MTYDCTPSNSHEGPTKCSPTWSRGTALWLAVIILHTAPNTLSTIRLFLRDCATVKRDRRISGYLLHTWREWESRDYTASKGHIWLLQPASKQGNKVTVFQLATNVHSYGFIDQIWCSYNYSLIPIPSIDCSQYEMVEELGSGKLNCSQWQLLSGDVPNPRNISRLWQDCCLRMYYSSICL